MLKLKTPSSISRVPEPLPETSRSANQKPRKKDQKIYIHTSGLQKLTCSSSANFVSAGQKHCLFLGNPLSTLKERAVFILTLFSFFWPSLFFKLSLFLSYYLGLLDFLGHIHFEALIDLSSLSFVMVFSFEVLIISVFQFLSHLLMSFSYNPCSKLYNLISIKIVCQRTVTFENTLKLFISSIL